MILASGEPAGTEGPGEDVYEPTSILVLLTAVPKAQRSYLITDSLTNFTSG